MSITSDFQTTQAHGIGTRDYDTVLDTSSPFAGGARMVLEAIIGGASDLAQVLSHGVSIHQHSPVSIR